MKVHLKQLETNCIVKNSGFVDSGFVKTCDEIIIGLIIWLTIPSWI